jgi:hypothetical protein
MQEELKINIEETENILLKRKIQELNTQIELMENKITLLMRTEDRLSRQINMWESKRKSAEYYDYLTALIQANPSLQSEWVKFVTFIKLIAEPEEIEKLK